MKYEKVKELMAEIKPTDIKGKAYVEVHQRIKIFREAYPEGSIVTKILRPELLEQGICLMRASVYDSGRLVAVGHAYEKEASSFINRTSYIENCVPLTTQMLTNNGWKYYFQLNDDDKALSYNMETGNMEYCDITRINLYKDRALLNLSTSRFNVTCTPQHKWLAKTQYKGIEKVPTEELTNSWKIVQAVPQEVKPSELGKRLGWLMCDCDIDYRSGLPSTAYISQSKHTKEIEKLFGKGKKVKKYKDTWQDNYEWVVPAEKVRVILGSFGIASYEDLPQAMINANLNDVAGCYESMMLADGSKGRFSSTYKALVEAVQIMCARLGIATTFVTSRMMKNSTKPLYEIGIKKTNGAYFSEMEVKNLPPQDVWCPTTTNGTWVMRQGSFVTLTSNCETSAVGRALGLLGIGIDTSIASAEEVANAIKNQNTADLPKDEKDKLDKTITKERAKELVQFAKALGWEGEDKEVAESLCKHFNVEKLSEVKESQRALFIKENNNG